MSKHGTIDCLPNIDNLEGREWMRTRVPIVKAKLIPPMLPVRLLGRECYHRLKEKMLNQRLTMVIAPAGYGKTTFLSLTANKCGSGEHAFDVQGYRLAWYTLDEMDANLTVFFTHLLASIKMLFPEIGEESFRMLNSIGDIERDYRLVSAAICEEIWQHTTSGGTKSLLIFDDYHRVASQAVTSVLEFFLTNLPPDWHLCLSGREHPSLQTYRLMVNEQLQLIGPAELAFDPAETEQLINNVYGLRLSRQQALDVAKGTEGWPAGVVMAAQALALSTDLDINHMSQMFTREHEAGFNFFAAEVLGRLPEPERRFLCGAAALSRLTVESCQSVLEEDTAGQRLENAARSGFFLTAVGTGNERTYRFHHLFQGCLRELQKRYFAPEEMRDLHKRAALYYEEKGLFDAAMEHMLAIEAYTEAAGLLRRGGEDLINRGYVDEVRYWLKFLPAAVVDEDPYLLYFKGFVYQHSNHVLALDCLDRAAEGLGDCGDLHHQVRALIYMATIYSLQNRVDQVKEAASRIPTVRAFSHDPWLRGVLTVSALCQAAWEDSLKRGVWLSRIARLLPLDPDWYWAMLAYSCMIYYRLGDLDISRRCIMEALELPVVKDNDVWKGLALILSHVVCYLQDDEETGHRVREELWDLGEKYDSAYYKAYAERARAFAFYHRGELKHAREILFSSLYFFEQNGNTAMASLTRLDLALLAANDGKAAGALDDARAAYDVLRSLDCGQGLGETGQSVFGAVAREAGALDLAEQHLLASAKISKRKGAKQVLYGTYLHLARLYEVKGDVVKADDYLRQSFSLGARAGYRVFWDWHRPTVLKMCLRAIERGIYPDYAGELLKHWFGQEAAATLKPLEKRVPARRWTELSHLINDLEKPKETATQVYSQMPFQFEVRLFGSFELKINGVAVSEKAWQTRHVKKLFKYLLFHRGRKVTRDQLMELLWPENDPKSAAASLRVTLSRLRQVLRAAGIDDAAGVVSAGQGVVWLREETEIICDMVLFEELVKRGQIALAGDDVDSAKQLWEQAVAIYSGNLLEEDIYEDWTVNDRERLQLLYLDTLLGLAGIYRRSVEADVLNHARDLLVRALAVNPYREDVNLELMRIYQATGQTGEALKLFEKYSRIIDEEFGIQPGRAIQELARELKGQSKGRD